MAPVICIKHKSPICVECKQVYEWEPRQTILGQGDQLKNADELLQAWFDWWAANPDTPAKLPDSLHTETAVYLESRNHLRDLPKRNPSASGTKLSTHAERRRLRLLGKLRDELPETD